MIDNVKNKDKEIGKRLRLIREHLGLTRQDLQSKYNLSSETLKSWESGKIGLTAKGLDRCLELYKQEKIVLSKEWVVTGIGLDPRLSAAIANIQLEAKLQTNNDIAISDFDLALKEVTFFRNLSSAAVVMQVSDNDMQPFYSPGDYVGGRYEVGIENWDKFVGKDCIISDTAGYVYIRRLAKHASGQFVLTLHNPYWSGAADPVIISVDIEKIAPIIWHRRLL